MVNAAVQRLEECGRRPKAEARRGQRISAIFANRCRGGRARGQNRRSCVKGRQRTTIRAWEHGFFPANRHSASAGAAITASETRPTGWSCRRSRRRCGHRGDWAAIRGAHERREIGGVARHEEPHRRSFAKVKELGGDGAVERELRSVLPNTTSAVTSFDQNRTNLCVSKRAPRPG